MAKASGFADSTWVSMESQLLGIIDSTMILNDRFQFKGHTERPMRVMLRIKKTGDRRMFWLENKPIDIVGKKGEFNGSLDSRF